MAGEAATGVAEKSKVSEVVKPTVVEGKNAQAPDSRAAAVAGKLDELREDPDRGLRALAGGELGNNSAENGGQPTIDTPGQDEQASNPATEVDSTPAEELQPEQSEERQLYSAGEKGRDFYTILGVSPEATPDEIQKSYRNLARRYHPDSPFFDHVADDVEKFKDVNEAYFVLSSTKETEAYQAGSGRYKDTNHPTRPDIHSPTEEVSADASQAPFTETASSGSYAPRRGENWSTYQSRVFEEFKIFEEGDPRRASFDPFFDEVKKVVYEEFAQEYKDKARARYQSRTGRDDFDVVYSYKSEESREDYVNRVREQLRTDLLDVENFEEVFSMLSDDMFPPPIQPLLVSQQETTEEGVAAQLIKAITDTGEPGLTQEQQEAMMDKPGFRVSLENDPQYKELLLQKIRELQERIERARREGKGYPDNIDKEIDSLKAEALAEFERIHPDDAVWYRKNSPAFDSEDQALRTSEEIAVRQEVAADTQ